MTIQYINAGEVVAFPDRNYSRPDGSLFPSEQSFADLVRSLVPGWDAILSVLAITPLDEKDVQEAKRHVQLLLDSHKESTNDLKIKIDGKTITISPADRLVAAQELYMPKGKILTPKYEVVAGFRRLIALVVVRAVQKKLDGANLINELPATITTYGSEVDRRYASIRENGAKTEGVLKLTHAQQLESSKGIFQLGARQVDFRNAYGVKPGTSQKMHRICQLDAKHPSLGIIEKAAGNKELWDAFDKEVVKNFLDEDAGADKVAAFLKAPREGKSNKAKMMARTKIEALANQCGVKIVADVCRAIINDDIDGMNKVITGELRKAEAARK